MVPYWAIPSIDVEKNRYDSPGQHRGNVGEGQLHLNQDNIGEFDRYFVKSNELERAIKQAFQRDRRLRGAE
ncbi:MAG: hypothetical protein AUJ92_14475 [Armatimonadetes bacterium CG2_30_59_28]|nr:MAG: hypothetical protein AUJ92_14475 [Armatimonadetes bacterium CG2_30_59_28]PIU64948.1 MAG: hypothetical protein COS85_10655 [Armatimonadetes bacterium CG07_land_8_20_14_0_80_59_28]PIX45931.1 MAG: hypothetical protein COZ56_00670 [Armatimonadetes bacterium CG_4_8_14_3_um_filter_58_9]PIY37124.1 MAG: hypothetical protein COZ05_22900 [Armatimonadetes bacterium CG_4_10_14_3_um_filter_59_10]